METKIDYDSDNDIAYFYPDEGKVDYSIDYDDVIIDVSGNKIVGIEIIDTSEKFAGMAEEIERLKKALKSIDKADMKIDYGQNSISIKVGFELNLPEKTREGFLIQVPIKKEMMVKI